MARELGLLSGILLLCLVPFAGKALHVDDPLFVWTAQQIAATPWDFYGFEVNWYGSPDPMWTVMQNPPGASYYLALFGSLFGWSEVTLHLALLLPALALASGTYVLARRFSSPPLLAALTATLTPGMLLSATTVMCDVIMLALWVWALCCWIRGLERDGRAELLLGAALAGACALTKYFGISLLPLLVIATLLHRKRIGRNLAFLLLPLAMLAAYQYATHTLYGRGLLLDAAAYVTDRQAAGTGAWLARVAAGLSFTGGSAASLLCLSPLLLTRRLALVALSLMAAIVPLSLTEGAVLQLHLERAVTTPLAPQLALWIVTGCGALALAVDEFRRERRSDTALLLLWVFGTFAFASLVNWTVNGRSVLPLLPALGILAGRRIARLEDGRPAWLAAGGLVAATALALTVTWADHGLASSARQAARAILSGQEGKSGDLWFQGHWGFQYYATRGGARALDMQAIRLRPGDIVAVPVSNTNVAAMPEAVARLVGTLQVPVPRWVATMTFRLGAGFYSSGWGPLPFAFGPVEPESYLVYEMLR